MKSCGNTSRALFGTLLLGAAACAGSARPKADAVEPQGLEVGNVRAFVVRKHDPDLPHAIPGDLALQGKALDLEVAGSGHADRRGALIALHDGRVSFDWESMLPLLGWDGATHQLDVERIRLQRVGDRPAIAVQANVHTQDTELHVERTLWLTDVGSALRVTTQVSLTDGSAPHDLAVIERVSWGGESPVAPLQAALQDRTPVVAEWVGRATDRRAVVVGSLTGSVRIIGSQVDHGHADLLRFTDIWLPTRVLPDARWQAETVVSVSPAGLGEAVRRFGWVRAQPFPELLVMLATDPPGAEVRIVDAANGNFVAAGSPDTQRRVILPLPKAAVGKALVAVALAHGREASPRVHVAGPPYAPFSLTIPEGSRLELNATHAVSGEPIPVRIRVLPQEGAPDPNLGPDWAASGAIDTVVAPEGSARISLPAGFYRIVATHGPEWSVYDEQVPLEVGQTTRIAVKLDHVVDPGSWVACEFHVHAAPSYDSQVSIEDRVASLAAEGIDLAVATDHNHVTDYGPAISSRRLRGLSSIPGVEVTTAEPRFGHFNAFPYPIDPDRPGNGAPEFHGLTAATLFASLHAVSPDLVVQVNHPRLEGDIGYFELTGYDPITGRGGADYSDDYDTLEVWNGFDLARRENVDRLFGEWLAMIARGRHLVATGSSDSHTIRSVTAGYPRTYVRAPPGGARDPCTIIQSLKLGHAFVTSGPFLDVEVDGHGPGDELLVRGDQVEVAIAVQIPAWMQISSLRIYLGAQLVYRAPLDAQQAGLAHRYAQRVRLFLNHSAPLVVAVDSDEEIEAVVARHGVRPFAFTNPIWLTKAPPSP